MSAAKKTDKKKQAIATLVEMRINIDALLATLCPPCPECCPPRFPLSPGEIANHGTGDISMCENCCGRGYIIENEGD
jgi:hypothetical protein